MKVARVHVLPPDLAGKIAAGEVVERPASVVKELAENALDAGATQIVIELERGGRELIRVVDDGCGIVTEDLPLVFARHATSKISSEADLNGIRSLGFRGEALAAIGSVAWVRLQSRTQEANVGGQIVCEGGQLGPLEAWAGPVGTCVEVRRLFFNTPARRKFLRSVATELGQIIETVQRLALAFAGVHFRLLHEGREVLAIPASWDSRERIAYFFGEDVAKCLIEVEYESRPICLHGWVGHPTCDRPNARWQYFFVNSRYVRDRVLSHALQEAYRGYLMVGRQPLAFLFLELPPEAVDVNVHPTKIEVRFRDQALVYQTVLYGVRHALQQAHLTASFTATGLAPASLLRLSGDQPAASDFVGPPARSTPTPQTSGDLVATSGPAHEPRPPTNATGEPHNVVGNSGTNPVPVEEASLTLASKNVRKSSDWPDARWAVTPHSVPTVPTPTAASSTAPEAGLFATPISLRAMQLHDTYLVVETPDGLLLVDQHALHERILYEQFQRHIQAGKLTQQPLLVPEPVDLTADQAAIILEHRNALETVGLHVSDFGGNTVLVSALPACWRRSAAELVHLAVEYLAEVERVPEPQVLLDDLLKRMACRAAIKAGDRLGAEEIAFLLEHRQLVENSHHCPHGRPTALFLSKNELERQFRRLG